MELLKKYQEQYKEFANITDMNIEARLMRVPAEKHFWVSRMVEAKAAKHKLVIQKNKLKRALIDKMVNDGVVSITKKTLDDIEKSEKFEELNEKLGDLEILIEYLDNVVKCITFIGQDMKNILTLKGMNE